MFKPAASSALVFARFLTISVASFAFAGAGCSSKNAEIAGAKDGGGGTPTSTVTSLPCDVDQVVVERCQSCHSDPPVNGAPMPLVTWDDFQAATPSDSTATETAVGFKVYQAVEERIHDTKSPMPQPPNPLLDSADLATMDAWLNGGTPKGTAACQIDAGPAALYPTVECNSDNVVLSPGSAWTMPADQDDQYVCYSVNVPVEAGTDHVLSITPNVVNHTIVHHVLLFQADPSDTSITETPSPCAAFGSVGWRIVYGWAPGGEPMTTPPGVGFPYDSTTKWVVQVHYNNINHLSGETDTSGFSLCSTSEPVAYDADVIAFGTQNIDIPPLSTLNQVSSFTVPALYDGAHIFAAFPHMHTLGMAIETEQVLPSGGIIDLGRNDPFSFQAQLWFPVESILHTGDVVNTRCEWQNSTSSEVTFGENTENEMCYSFTAYYPRVTNGLSWSLPALSSNVSQLSSPSDALPTPDAGWSVPSDAGTD
jgi:hypothetical protein